LVSKNFNSEILVGKKNGKKNSANSRENVTTKFAKKLG